MDLFGKDFGAVRVSWGGDSGVEEEYRECYEVD